MTNKMTLFNYGQFILKALNDSPYIAEHLGDRVIALKVPEGTTVPYIRFNKTGGWYDYNKDTCVSGNLEFEILVVSKTFTEVEEIAEHVDEAMDANMKGGLSRARLVSSYAFYDDAENLYGSLLTYQMLTY